MQLNGTERTNIIIFGIFILLATPIFLAEKEECVIHLGCVSVSFWLALAYSANKKIPHQEQPPDLWRMQGALGAILQKTRLLRT